MNTAARIAAWIFAYGLTILGLILLAIFGLDKVAIIGFAALLVWTLWKARE